MLFCFLGICQLIVLKQLSTDRKAFIDDTRDKCELCVRLKAGISHVGCYGTAAIKELQILKEQDRYMGI